MNLAVGFVVVTCRGTDGSGCDVTFAMSEATYDETRATGRDWYCPNGHRRCWTGKTTTQKLRDAEAREVHLADQLRASEASAEAARVATARLLQRAINGVCPCCKRSFENLRRHVATMHPDLTVEQREVVNAKPVFRCSCSQTFSTFHGLRVHQGKVRDDRWDDPKRDLWGRHLTVTGR